MPEARDRRGGGLADPADGVFEFPILKDGPQEITVHGKPAAIMLSVDDYARLAGGKRSFVDFVRQSPLCGAALVVKRDRSPVRRIRL